ncbi:MAG: hypothetical protein DME59_14865 [Verrucomicrobia bacterium]|nr:MAG: hypothetical protein DME59_14865 [Verrucomicrobiota bacterium]
MNEFPPIYGQVPKIVKYSDVLPGSSTKCQKNVEAPAFVTVTRRGRRMTNDAWANFFLPANHAN